MDGQEQQNHGSVDGVVDRPLTPAEQRTVDEGRRKLNEMTRGKYLGTKSSPSSSRTGPPAHYAGAASAARRDQREAEYAAGKADVRYFSEEEKAAKAAKRGEQQEQQPHAAVAALREGLAKRSVSPEARVKAANANPALWDPTHKDHEAARRELLEAVGRASTPEEDAAFAEAPIEEQRKWYGIEPPGPDLGMPSDVAETYFETYGNWESMFLASARQDGLDADLVRDLRDDGIRLGMQVDGKPLDEKVLDKTLARYGDRLTAGQRHALKQYWRSIEGGGA